MPSFASFFLTSLVFLEQPSHLTIPCPPQSTSFAHAVMSQPPPEADSMPETGAKRSQSDCETTSPEPKIKAEPDAKRQRVDEEITAPVQQSLNIIDIDPSGDLMILFESANTASSYRVDSNAIKRASPELYQQCLSIRSGSAAWVFNGVPKYLEGVTEVMLNLIHANMDKIPESMTCAQVHNIVAFAKRYEILDRFYGSLKQWYHGIPSNCHPITNKACKCIRLWTAYQLGLEEEFKALQGWAIFNLCDDGKGALGDPLEQLNGTPLELSTFWLQEEVVIDRLIRLRSEAVNFIMTKLKEVQLALFPSGSFGKDGRINNKFGGCGCSKCLDLWFGCLGKSLLRPVSLNPAIWRDFPSLSPVIEIEAKQYHRSLEELCAFVEAIQKKMNGYVACARKGQLACYPPQLIGRKAVEDLISHGLQAPLGAT